MRRSLALSFIVLSLTAANAFAGSEARLVGKVIDVATREPIKDAVITLDAVEMKKVNQQVKSKADGSYAAFVLDGTIKYKFTVSAPGYAPYEETIKLKIADTTKRDIELAKGSGAAPAAGGQMVPNKADPGVEAYNAGADLANAGDLAGAAAKFEEAVKANADLTAAWMALARVSYKTKTYARAVEAANKVVELDDDQPDMWTVLYHSYTALGDKANAAKAEKKLPKNAGGLFNEAARLINAGDDAGAERALKSAIEIDGAYAAAYYELGMVYVRTGKNADAKAALSKYLELDPNGKDAATAKEMLSYVK